MVTNNIGPIRLSSVEHKVHMQGIKLFDFQILNFYMGIIDVILNYESKFSLRFSIIYDTHL